MSGIAGRIVLASVAVAATAIGVVAIGVLVFGGAAFEQLMVEHGETVAAARAMFDQTVSATVVLAGIAAAAVSVALLARRIGRPLRQVGRAARRVAEGDLSARVLRTGPEEIRSLADSFNQMAERLAEQELLRREFIANAAHELRTPLTNLQGYLEALRDGVMPPDRTMFESLHEEADRLVRLSRSLDALAEGELATAPPVLVEIDLGEAIASAVQVARASFELRRIVVAIDVPRGLCAHANPDHLAQVLANLLQNAVRYTPEDGRVAVSAESRTAEVLVGVTNTGESIPADDLSRVFERFYRVEKSRDRARGGAGIGLAIVKRLVELGGGSVGVESANGLTRFWFSLPRVT